MSYSHYERCPADEVFIGNSANPEERAEWFRSNGITSCRIGEVAYDIDGNKIPAAQGIRPLFIKRSQYDSHNNLCEREFSKIRRG